MMAMLTSMMTAISSSASAPARLLGDVNEDICHEPTDIYIMGVALRSFFLVLATHLLAGEVDTSSSFKDAPFLVRLSWTCRYFNPLNLSWRYYSMLAYRCIAKSWGPKQLALINHEEHPLMPPLPYIVGETIDHLEVPRLEMAGPFSAQGIITLSAAYQAILAIQYAISTEGIPYLPNVTVPLAIMGLLRVIICKWVASKIHVEPYPYPPMPNKSAQDMVGSSPSSTPPKSTFLSKPKICPNLLESPSPLTVSSAPTRTSRNNSSTPLLRKADTFASSQSATTAKMMPTSPSLSSTLLVRLADESSTSVLVQTTKPTKDSSSSSHYSRSCSFPTALSSTTVSFFPTIQYEPPTMPQPQFNPASATYTDLCPTTDTWSFETYGCLSLSSTNSQSKLLRSRTFTSSSSFSSLGQSSSSVRKSLSAHFGWQCLEPPSSTGFVEMTNSKNRELSSPTYGDEESSDSASCQKYHDPFHYKPNKIVFAVWVGLLVGLLFLTFLPYKVKAAYQLPHRLLKFSIQLFYQYIAVTESIFHGFLLYQGPRALANRVLFFDHWTYKAQTVVFLILLTFMLVVAVIDFVKHGFYRTCA